MKKSSIRCNRWLVAAASAAVMGTGGLWLGAAPSFAASPTKATQVVRELPDFVSLVEEVGPSVVNIRTTERVRMRQYRGRGGGMDDDMQEFFRRFFGVPLPGMPHSAPGEDETPQPPIERDVPRGVGSGFIVSDDGYVMTNAHVIDGADEVYVTLNDKREFKAKVIGLDKRTDVAVVKIDAKDLPTVRIGNVSDLKVGEWVIAIGSPFDLENTVTSGIVSAKHRDTGDYLPFIQTDVAVNPGNSGGPLINMAGEVVGINSQIYSRSGGFMGISFAIPIDEAMRIGDQLRSSGHVTRGRIGVRIDRVGRDVAESIGLDRSRGALVSSVEADSPAQKAGIEAGDIILSFKGKDIGNVTDLPRLVGGTEPGTQTTVTVFRRGKEHKLDITVGLMEPDDAEAGQGDESARSRDLPSGSAQALGLTVTDMTEAERREANVKRGVRIESAEGAGARAGLMPGDIVLNVGNAEINSVADFKTALKTIDDDKAVNMLVQRDDVVQFVLIRPGR